MSKINFLVYIDVNFIQALTGGVVVMHQLAKKIAEKGESVYMVTAPEYPHPNIKLFDINEFGEEQLQNFVVIYPQIVKGNPAKIPNVSRWFLYHSEEEIENTYHENDEYFNFGTFHTFKKKSEKILTVFNYYFDIFKNENRNRFKKFCHLIHKNTPQGGGKIFEMLNSEDLGGWKTLGCQDYLKERFNNSEYFLTYDQKSFFPVGAGLCGTKTVILNPNPNISPTEYRQQNPIQMFGVAYGWGDLSWAEKTIDLVPDYIHELDKIDNKTVDNFIKFWYSKLNM